MRATFGGGGRPQNAITVYRIFIFLLIFSPLAFGTVEQWSLTLMETASILALCLFFIGNIHTGKILYKVPGIVPLLLVLVYMIVQLIPLPPQLLKFISPAAYSLYAETSWAGGHAGWGSLSICGKATVAEFFRFSSYAAFYFLTVQILSKKEFLKKTVYAVILFGALVAFFAILQYILPNNKIYWVRGLTYPGMPFGPYVNKDHYAGLMEMIFPVVLSSFLLSRPYTGYQSLRERISEALNQKGTNVHILLGLSAVLISTSVFLSLSRGGIISLSLSMIFFCLLIAGRRKRSNASNRALIIIAIFALIVLAVGWFGWGPIFEKFKSLRDEQGGIHNSRFDIWKDCIKIVGQFPLTGTGFGTFVDIYPKYRSIAAGGLLQHAHNDYIELASDGGIIACLLMGWFLLAVLYRSFRTFLKRREPYSVYLFVGSVTGLLSILVHSFGDFNLQIGANGLYFFFLAGLVVSAAHTRMRDGVKEDTLLAKKEYRHGRIFKIPALALLFCCLIFNIGVLGGKYFSPSMPDGRPEAGIRGDDLARVKSMAYKASLVDPLESKYHYEIANAEWLSSNREDALVQYRKAVTLEPTNAGHLQTLGLALADFREEASADKLLRAGIDCDKSNPARYEVYSSWLISRGEKEAGLGYIKKAMALEPQKTRKYITFLVLYGLDDEDIRNSLPERVEPHLSFADYLSETGRDDLAKEEYLTALGYVGNEREISPSYFLRVYRYFAKKGMTDEAVTVMRRAVDALPANADVRLAAGEAYEKSGLRFKAIEEYKHALLIDPRNARAKKKLDELG
jgi:O-antigen ligase/tetratricopeptide (TPR) repeat protein